MDNWLCINDEQQKINEKLDWFTSAAQSFFHSSRPSDPYILTWQWCCVSIICIWNIHEQHGISNQWQLNYLFNSTVSHFPRISETRLERAILGADSEMNDWYSKTWVSDHLAWATTLTWATVFSCTDAILVHFTLSPATTWQTRPVAYLELVIYLLNATIILLQNTKLTVKFTRDGRPYPHLTPHCRWPGRLLFMVGPWLTGTTGSQTPCGLLTIAHLIALAS